ncbi:MAG: lipoprotein [Vitreoscilla sp.]|nr:lipoprotein [Burkholderiales bacterium]MBP6337312.1 lipoprotein [Vitreoscilla sp.]
MGATAATALILLALAGCGQRGPLVLPAKPGAAQATAKPPAPTASSPGPAVKY